jgi:hypothetical protein
LRHSAQQLAIGSEDLQGQIRVRGDLASRFFGDPSDPTAAIAPTWVIYMNVRDVDVVREAGRE